MSQKLYQGGLTIYFAHNRTWDEVDIMLGAKSTFRTDYLRITDGKGACGAFFQNVTEQEFYNVRVQPREKIL